MREEILLGASNRKGVARRALDEMISYFADLGRLLTSGTPDELWANGDAQQ